MTTTTAPELAEWVPTTRLALYGAYATIAACVVNALVRLLALGVFGVPADFDPLAWGPILNTTVVSVVGATAVYGLLARVSTRPTRTFTIVAAVVLALSFVPLVAPPSFLAGAPWSVLATLGVMHVTTAAVAVGLLPKAIDDGAKPE